MTGTNCKYKKRLAEVEDESASMILSLQQQVNTLQHQLEIQTKAAEIGAKNLIVAEQQVNTLTEALKEARLEYSGRDRNSTHKEVLQAMLAHIDKALQSIKESPREEQGK